MKLIFDRDALGPPPEGLNDAARQAWADIAEHCPPGVLEMADRFLIELAAYMLAGVRAGKVEADKLAALHGLLDECFYTPEGKAKLGLPPVGPRK